MYYTYKQKYFVISLHRFSHFINYQIYNLYIRNSLSIRRPYNNMDIFIPSQTVFCERNIIHIICFALHVEFYFYFTSIYPWILFLSRTIHTFLTSLKANTLIAVYYYRKNRETLFTVCYFTFLFYFFRCDRRKIEGQSKF